MTKTDLVVCHFGHRDFERCKIMDKHLTILARRYFTTRFIKISAPVRISLGFIFCVDWVGMGGICSLSEARR